MNVGDANPSDEMKTNPDADQLAVVKACLSSRRSISRFLPKAVDEQYLVDAIEVARWAPNHHLTQPWHFYILGPAAVQATVDMAYTLGCESKNEEIGNRKARRAEKVPAWVVVTSARSDDTVLDREDYAATCCAIHNFSLYLWQAGIGMKWCTGPIVDDRRYYQQLGIDMDRSRIAGVLRVGYAAVVPGVSRNNLSQMMSKLK